MGNFAIQESKPAQFLAYCACRRRGRFCAHRCGAVCLARRGPERCAGCPGILPTVRSAEAFRKTSRPCRRSRATTIWWTQRPCLVQLFSPPRQRRAPKSSSGTRGATMCCRYSTARQSMRWAEHQRTDAIPSRESGLRRLSGSDHAHAQEGRLCW